MARPGTFHYTAVFNDKVFHLAKFMWDFDTTSPADVYAGIAKGFRDLADNFDFAGIMEGYEDDGEESATG